MPGTGLYLRSIEEVDIDGNVSIVPLIDRLTDIQLSAANVIILFAETIELKPTLHDFTLVGNRSGRPGMVFRDGQMYEITWRSQGEFLPLQFLTTDGEVLPLKPGNTWIHIVGISSNRTETTNGEWSVINFIP